MTAATNTYLPAAEVHETIARHMLADGFDMVLDLDASNGSTLVDARDGRRYLDLFTFFASSALGMNHPALAGDAAFRDELAAAAVNKPSNSDVYTVPMARFVETFARVLGDAGLPHLFFVDGGALAVENALKVAFDWKSRWNESHGIDPALGTKVLHLQKAFHGRSGYTMSLTKHRPEQGRALPEVRLAAHPVAVDQRDRRRRGGRARGARRGPGRIRAEPARHRLLHRRADPGRGRRQPLPSPVPAGHAGTVPRVRTRCSSWTRCRPASA